MPWTKIEPSWLAHLVRETSAVVWIGDADGYVLDVPEWCRLTGQTPQEAEGDGWMDAIHPDDRMRAAAAWRTAVAHASKFNTDYRVCCADGVYRWVNARGVPILRSDGSVAQWIGVILIIAGGHRMNSLISDRQRTNGDFTVLPPAALRAARAILGWSANTLADRCGLSLSTIRRLEDEGAGIQFRSDSVRSVLDTLRAAGVQFSGTEGVIHGVALPHHQPRA